MPLSEADKALLQLFLEGGLDYQGAASVLSRSPEEVSDGARAALSRISGQSGTLPPSISDWLLGQADPIATADAVTILARDEAARRQAVVTSSALKLIFPGARIPDIPTTPQAPSSEEVSAPPVAPGAGLPPTPPPPNLESTVSRSADPTELQSVQAETKAPVSSRFAERLENLSSRTRRRPALVAIGSAAVLLGVIALAVILLGGSEKKGSGASAKGSVTLVPLSPTSAGGRGEGRAVILSSKKAAIVQANMAGLTPTSGAENYVLWLYRSPDQAYPLARDKVGKTGRLTGPAPIPQDLKPPLEEWGCIELTLASRGEIAASLRRVASTGSGPAVGRSILRGEIAPSNRDPRSGNASVCIPSSRG